MLCGMKDPSKKKAKMVKKKPTIFLCEKKAHIFWWWVATFPSSFFPCLSARIHLSLSLSLCLPDGTLGHEIARPRFPTHLLRKHVMNVMFQFLRNCLEKGRFCSLRKRLCEKSRRVSSLSHRRPWRIGNGTKVSGGKRRRRRRRRGANALKRAGRSVSPCSHKPEGGEGNGSVARLVFFSC